MGTVYRKTATKLLPAGAKVIVRKGQRLTVKALDAYPPGRFCKIWDRRPFGPVPAGPVVL